MVNTVVVQVHYAAPIKGDSYGASFFLLKKDLQYEGLLLLSSSFLEYFHSLYLSGSRMRELFFSYDYGADLFI